MATCPECGEEITHLKGIQTSQEFVQLSLDSKGDPQRLVVDNDITDEDCWYCPECDKTFTEEDAVKILHGTYQKDTGPDPDELVDREYDRKCDEEIAQKEEQLRADEADGEAKEKQAQEEENYDDVIPEK